MQLGRIPQQILNLANGNKALACWFCGINNILIHYYSRSLSCGAFSSLIFSCFFSGCITAKKDLAERANGTGNSQMDTEKKKTFHRCDKLPTETTIYWALGLSKIAPLLSWKRLQLRWGIYRKLMPLSGYFLRNLSRPSMKCDTTPMLLEEI